MSAQTQPTGSRVDPFANFRFRISIAGLDEVAEFNECAGLEMQVKYDELREGGENTFVHRLPTRVEYGNLTLKRGYVSNSRMFSWCLAPAAQGKIERRNVTVTLVHLNDNQAVFQWTFANAYPVKWSGPALKSGENGLAIESLELAHEGLQIQ